MKNKTAVKFNNIIIYIGIFIAFVLIDIIFIFLVRNDVKTLSLITQERISLKNQERIISTSSDIAVRYKNEIKSVSDVFPNEETIPLFIQSLESMIRASTDEYTFRFSSLTPVDEGDKKYLLMSVTMKTDYNKLILFLSELEKMPYMTHITSLNAKTPAGFTDGGEFGISLKVYVQNPFTI